MVERAKEKVIISPAKSDAPLDRNESFESPFFVFQTKQVTAYKNENGEKMVNEFIKRETIGHGGFSKVKRATRQYLDKLNELHFQDYAMKIIHKPTLRKERAVRYLKDGEMLMLNNLDKIYEEINIWSLLNTPNIIRLYEVLDDPSNDYLYLIMEFSDLGQLSNWNFKELRYIRSQKIVECINEKFMTGKHYMKDFDKYEDLTRILFKDVLLGIIDLHKMGIVHRDIKLDNLLYSSKDEYVKLTDFTVSKKLESEEELSYDREGTAAFTAPECHTSVIEGYKPKPADIWSFGISLMTYLQEEVPFFAESELEMQLNTQNQVLEYPEYFSAELVDLLTKLLAKDPAARPTALQIKDHPWFSKQL